MPSSHATAVGSLVGGSLASYPPCFSGDDKLLCVPCESSVKLFSTATGEQVGCLAGLPIGSDPDLKRKNEDGSLAGHTRTVTCVMAHPSNRVQVYTASLDGTMKLWDLYDQTCVATYPIKIGGEGDAKFDRPPILHMVKGAADLVYLLVDPYMVHSITSSSSSSNAAAASSSSSTAVTPSAASTTTSPSNANASTEILERERACRIVLFQLSKQTSFILYKVKDATRLAIDPSLKLLAAISGKILRIYDTLGKRSKSTFKKQMPFNLHTVTFHPSEPYLTLGDEKGHILILYGYTAQGTSNHAKPSATDLVTQTLHWHAHKVGAVLFTQDGHYMLSGGEEGVLVIWQLETGTKQFIPRLQASIMHISMSHDGNTYALSMGDNRIKFVSAVSNRVERVIAGLSYSSPAQSSGGASYLVANPSASISPAAASTTIVRRVTPTDDSQRSLAIPFLYSPHHAGWFLSSVSGGGLQLFDIYGDKHIADMDLLQRNVLSRTEDETSNAPRLESMAISPLGDKMVTTERRSGNVAAGAQQASSVGNGSGNDTIVMKFWDWHTHSSSFVLNTRIDPPHSHASQHLALSTLLWHPNPDEKMVVTIGKDACFKIWREIKKVSGPNVRKERRGRGADGLSQSNEMDAHETEEAYWNCTGVGHYRAYPTSSGAFSSDGSLLAVSYGQVLTLWDPYTLTLKHTLLHPSPSHPIRFVAFLPNTPFLLTTTANAMYVWNLLTLSLWWSYDLRVISYAVHDRVDHDKGYFAVMVLSPEEEDARPENRTERRDEQVDGQLNLHVPFKRRQTHLLLFTVHSPVPLRVWPLRDARLDSVSFSNVANPGNKAHHTTSAFASPILFANDPQVERASKRGGGGGASKKVNPTSLCYINYKRQLVRFDDIFDDEPSTRRDGLGVEAASAAAMARLVEQNEEISLFEQLYGKAHRPVPPRGATHHVAPTVTTPGTANLASLLGGPSHILPPPSSLFQGVMDGLVKKPIRSIVSGKEQTAASAAAQSQSTQQQQQADDARITDATQAAGEASPSAVQEDAALLAADSTATGGLFAWDSLATLGPSYNKLVSMMHDTNLKVTDDAIVHAPSSASVSVDRKRKKDSPAATDSETKSKSKAKTKSPKIAPTNGDDMEIDEAPLTTNKTKKGSKK